MKYEIPESEDIEWQQDMLREIDCALDVLREGGSLTWMAHQQG